ncbi:unnamed protein product [Paramecium octaurelia]|uniref:Uncharacterized protein n=1 Tax=Paramecium octaurelia TaxID=43137 RepID=A0A8S1XZ05_PAROT|nr:unnamed protein product [Paramecium octaurelia]
MQTLSAQTVVRRGNKQLEIGIEQQINQTIRNRIHFYNNYEFKTQKTIRTYQQP